MPIFNNSNRLGFTIVELLIAISILSILATVGTTIYSKVGATGRDHRRKQDIDDLKNALYLYKFANGQFPFASWSEEPSNMNIWAYSGDGSWQGFLGILVPGYLKSLPIDPKNNCPPIYEGSWGTNCYGYNYWSGTSASYNFSAPCPLGPSKLFIIVARLENANDQQTITNSGRIFCGRDINDLIYKSISPNDYVIVQY